MLYKVVLTFESGWNPMVWPFKWKLLIITFLWYCLLWCTRWFYLIWNCTWNPILCDLSNEHSSSVFPYRSTSLSRCTYSMKFWRFFFVFQCNLSEMKTGLSDCSFCFCVIRNPHLLKAPVSRIERLILNILQVSNRTVLKTTLKKVTATLKKRCCMQISY